MDQRSNPTPRTPLRAAARDSQSPGPRRPRKTTTFISYSRQDKPFVDRLVDDLQAAGLAVWRDTFEIEPGDPIVDGIQAALETCSFFVVVLTPRSLASPWVHHEWTTWMSLQLAEQGSASDGGAGSRRRLVPMTLGDCAIPAFLQALEAIAIAEDCSDYDSGLARLLNVLGGGPVPPPRPASGFRDDRVGALKFASVALRALLDSQFTRVTRALDPEGFAAPVNPIAEPAVARSEHVARLIELITSRGAGWSDKLQEALLEVRSPFSPFDGTTLQNWVGEPSECWSAVNAQIVGAGTDPPVFVDQRTPADLADASILRWEGLAFRDARLSIRLWMPQLPEPHACGVLLRGREQRSGLVAILRRKAPDSLDVELWRRQAELLRPVAAAKCNVHLMHDCCASMEITLDRQRIDVRVTADADRTVSIASLAGVLPADDLSGHFALIKFNGAALAVSLLEIAVHARPHP